MGFSDMAPYLEGAFLSSMMQDWQQTTKFLRYNRHLKPGQEPYSERNPILGKNPSEAEMTGFGAVLAAGQYGLYRSLSDEWKTPFALASLIADGYTVNQNRKLGLPLDNKALGLGALVTALEVYRHNNAKEKSNLDIRATYDNGPGFLMNYKF